ncbi:hypothetical protein [Candidatus Phytoplasma solani]|uniref:hypothetical protein n=1 Tax=Candidatus Phytoplasma solani TaxID=69896 RepID=UPI00358EB0CD
MNKTKLVYSPSLQKKITQLKVWFFILLIIVFLIFIWIQTKYQYNSKSLSLPNYTSDPTTNSLLISQNQKNPKNKTNKKRWITKQNNNKNNLHNIKKTHFFKPLKKQTLNSPNKINLLKISHNSKKTKILNICQHFPPQLEEQIQDMNIYNIYLGKESNEKKALEWLNTQFREKRFVKNLVYGLYNDQIGQYNYVNFNSRLKGLTPEKLLLVYFDQGLRKNTDRCYSFEALKNLGNGAKNMYIFWQDESPSPEQNFWQNNFYTDLIYEKGSGYDAPAYLNIQNIVLKRIDNNETVATFPVKCQIKAPLSLHNYDLELRAPYYKYKYRGLFWKTRKIKRIQKIELYDKQTGEKRILYYKN